MSTATRIAVMAMARRRVQLMGMGALIVGDMGDMYRGWDELRKKEKEEKHAHAHKWLKDNGVIYDSKNMGTHIILKLECQRIDFWPSTDKIKINNYVMGNGLATLKKIMENKE